jgi:hypothetical protein
VTKLFAYGNPPGVNTAVSNLVSNTGVIASDTAGVGTARSDVAAASYGNDKAIFGYGYVASPVAMSNLVNNSGVVAADVSGVGTARYEISAAGYSFTA